MWFIKSQKAYVDKLLELHAEQDINGKKEPKQKNKTLYTKGQLSIIFFRVFISSLIILITFAAAYEAYKLWSKYEKDENAVNLRNKVAKEIYFRDNSSDVALKLINEALEIDRDNAELIYTKAFIESMGIADRLLDIKDRVHTKEEIFDAHKALANAEFLLKNEEEEHISDAYFIKSQIYLALKEHEKAEKNIKEAIEKSNIETKIYFEIRKQSILIEKSLIENRKHDLSSLQGLIDKLEKRIKLKNSKTSYGYDQTFLKLAYNWQGVAQENNGDIDASDRSYQKAIEIDKKYSDALYNYAESLTSRLNPNESNMNQVFEIEDKIRSLLKADPGNKTAYYLWGYLYAKLDRYEASIGYYDKALDLDKDYFDARLWKGVSQLELSEYNKSLEEFNYALKLNPDSYKGHQRRIQVYAKQKKFGLFEDNLNMIKFLFWKEKDKEKKNDIKKNLYRALVNCANAYIGNDQLTNANKFLEEAQKLKVNDEKIYFALADYYLKKHEYQNVLIQLGKIVPSFQQKNSYIKYYDKKITALYKLSKKSLLKETTEIILDNNKYHNKELLHKLNSYKLEQTTQNKIESILSKIY